jgi:hypothetical protein
MDDLLRLLQSKISMGYKLLPDALLRPLSVLGGIPHRLQAASECKVRPRLSRVFTPTEVGLGRLAHAMQILTHVFATA